jgi:hypothetical protein
VEELHNRAPPGISGAPEVPLATVSDLTAQLEAIDARYRGRFAGHPRISRDPEELEAIQAEVTALASAVKGLKDSALNERYQTSVDLYKNELALIQEARAAGPAAVQAHRITSLANLVMGRYSRFYAGQNRTTRDVGLLEELAASMRELVADLEKCTAQGANVAEDLGRMKDAAKVYADECGAIRSARGDGPLPDQAQRLATLANEQFERYRLLFAAQTRISRHPDTLASMIKNIREIHAAMLALRTRGVGGESHAKNIAIVGERIESWEAELITVRDVIARGELADRVGRLGEAANKAFSEYREHFAGKDRKTRDLKKLSNIIEQLWPIQRSMDAIDSDNGDDTNARNLSIVTDQLRIYDREYRNIVQAKAEA